MYHGAYSLLHTAAGGEGLLSVRRHTDGALQYGPFSIKPASGLITLDGQLDKSQVSYKLRVVATDDGSCCHGGTTQRSEGLVIVEVKDINNNAPRFLDCASYTAEVEENANVHTSVIKVPRVW